MQRMTGCPDCGVAVPVGRWCNRCGARLDTPNVRPAPAISVPHLGQFAALVLSLMLVITVVQFAPTVDGGALGGAGGDVALPATSDLNDPPFVPYRTVMWATVVCSSIDLRQVPLRQIGGADIGELVALPVGDCVVHARPQAGRAGVGTASLAR